jgi:hypothetical protein
MKHFARVLTLLMLTAISTFAQQQKPDIIDFRKMDPLSCCFDVSLENVHEPDSPLNYLELRILSPGVFFEPGAGGPWPTIIETDTLMVFGDVGIIIQPGEVIEGFNVCFRFQNTPDRTVRVEWRTRYNARVATLDTLELDCSVQIPTCDSVDIAAITIPTQPDGTCCYELTLKNRHDPAGGLNGFKIVVLTSGAMIEGTPSGPWTVTERTLQSVTYGTTGSPLASGADLKGFRFCVSMPQGNPGTAVFHWYSLSNAQTVCEGDVSNFCTPKFLPRGDTLLLKKQQDCSYDIGFINKHIPASNLTAFRLSVITPGASFASVSAPSGWTIGSQTALNVQFNKVGTPIASRDSVKGFLVTFKPSSSGLVRFAWTTYNGSTIVTRDTVQVLCDPPPPTFCDSLLVTPLAASCSYDFGFINKHQPQSEINDFHISLQSAGATIDTAIAPTGWIIESQTLTDIDFRDTTGVIGSGQQQTGFILRLTPGNFGDVIVYEWCTSLDGSILCCEFGSVGCAPAQPRCDSLAVAAAQDYCSYEFSLSNLRIPNSGLDAFSIRLDNPAAMLLSAEAPTGWTLDTLDEQMLRYTRNSGLLMTGETANGFVVHFVPSATSSQIPFTWCTELAGQTRCCDTLSVACEIKLVECDVIDVVTSTERPCCFEFNVRNAHLPRSIVNGFNVQIITPGVTLFNSTITDPDAWTHISNSSLVGWRSLTTSIAAGESLGGFTVCYDNSAINNADFQVVTQTVGDGRILCVDTLTIKCDRTLVIERLPGSQPESYRLHQNYPNPFNPLTTIVFDLPQRADLALSLYDAHGRLVMDLGSGTYEAGSWSVTLDASALPSGTYHYQLRSAAFTETRSMILLK